MGKVQYGRWRCSGRLPTLPEEHLCADAGGQTARPGLSSSSPGVPLLTAPALEHNHASAVTAWILALRLLLIACLCHVAACHSPVAKPPPVLPAHSPLCARVRPVWMTVQPETLVKSGTTAPSSGSTFRTMAIPPPLIEAVLTAGKSTVFYTVEVCGGTPPSVRSVEHSTGFPDLDHFVDSRIPDLDLELPPSGCVTATIILHDLDRACDVQP